MGKGNKIVSTTRSSNNTFEVIFHFKKVTKEKLMCLFYYYFWSLMNQTLCSCMLKLYKDKGKELLLYLCSFIPRSRNKFLIISIKLRNLTESLSQLNGSSPS